MGTTHTYIHSHCYYEGTEQISIYIKTGFGANEKTINELISEHKLNVISLGEVADFGKIKIKLKTKYDAKRKRE